MVKSTHVYHVAAEDSISKILRMLPKVQAKTFILVVPKDVMLMRNEVNLRLLTAYADEAGIELAVVSEDKLTRRRAIQYGMRVFDSAEGPIKKRKSASSPPKTSSGSEKKARESKKRRRPVRFLLLFGLCLLTVLIGFYAFFPRFHVWVELQYEEIQFAKQVNLAALDVKTVVEEQHIHVTRDIVATGTERIGVEKAQGVVVLLNAGAEDIVLPAGTEFATESGIRFTADDDIVVPGREMHYYLGIPAGVQSGRTEAYVTAVHPGSIGNVAAESVRIVDGHWDDITVRNPMAMQGGKDREIVVITEEDIAAGERAVQNELLAEHARRLQAYEKDNEHISILGTAWVRDENVTFSHHAGEENDTLRVTATAHFKIFGIPKDNISEFVAKTISNDIPFGYTWNEKLGLSMSITRLIEDDQTIELVGNIQVQPVIDMTQLTRMIAGQRVQEAVAVLENTEGVYKAGVNNDMLRTVPKWTPWIRITTKQ